MEPIALPQAVTQLPEPSVAQMTVSAESETQPIHWHVGTLSYSSRSLMALLSWLIVGNFAMAVRDRSITTIFQLLLGKFHVSDLLASVLLVSIPQCLTIILAPIVGYKSDCHRGPWGRRLPFLLIPIPLVVLGIVGLALSPLLGSWVDHLPGARASALDRLVLIFLAAFWMLLVAFSIIGGSVAGAFFNDVVPHPVLGRFFAVFRAVSLIAGILFFFLLGTASVHYVPMLIGIAMFYGVGFSVMCMKVKEGKYPPATDSDCVPTAIAAIRTYFRQCFSTRYYYWVFAAMIVPSLASLPANTFNLYFSQSVGMSTSMYGKLFAANLSTSLLMTIPLGWLADKFHPLRVAMGALILKSAAELLGGLYIHDATTFGIAFVSTAILSGTWLTATAAMTQLLLPKMKFAQYSSALAIVSSVSMMVFGPCMGRLLDLTHHQYRYIYLAGFILDIFGLLITIVVFEKFKALGGSQAYVAPESKTRR
jgi:MFS family permease